MIKHVVMFKFKSSYSEEEKTNAAEEIKAALDALPSEIDVIRSFESGIDEIGADRSCDLVLISEFESYDDLETYRIHPAHQAVIGIIGKHKEAAFAVDYTI